MKPRGVFRGAIAGMLTGIGVTASGGIGPSSVAAETAVPAGTVLVIDVWQLNRLTVQ